MPGSQSHLGLGQGAGHLHICHSIWGASRGACVCRHQPVLRREARKKHGLPPLWAVGPRESHVCQRRVSEQRGRGWGSGAGLTQAKAELPSGEEAGVRLVQTFEHSLQLFGREGQVALQALAGQGWQG